MSSFQNGNPKPPWNLISSRKALHFEEALHGAQSGSPSKPPRVLRNLDPLGVTGQISRSRTLQKAGPPSKKLIPQGGGTTVGEGSRVSWCWGSVSLWRGGIRLCFRIQNRKTLYKQSFFECGHKRGVAPLSPRLLAQFTVSQISAHHGGERALSPAAGMNLGKRVDEKNTPSEQQE